jgi:hypothetical protein
LFRITKTNEKDSKSEKVIQFILIPANEADQITLNAQVGALTRGLTERPPIAYLKKTKEDAALSYRLMMHPQLAAQVVQSMLMTQLGTSAFRGFENKNCG